MSSKSKNTSKNSKNAKVKTAAKTAKKVVANKAKPVKKTAKKVAPTKKVAKKVAPVKKTAKKPAPVKKIAKAITKKANSAKKAVKKATPAKTTKKPAPAKKLAKKAAPVKKAEKKAPENKIKEQVTKKEPKIEAKKEESNVILFKPRAEKKALGKKHNFKVGEHAVYPSHGIGKIIDIEKMVVLGQDFSCYLIYFEKEKLTIKVPVTNAQQIGLRPLVSKEKMDEVFTILRSGIKKMKGMWSRRAQEYEAKINSGDIIELAEVLRDLARDIEDGERSYSERIIYETAVARLAAEFGAIHKIDFEKAKEEVISTAKDKLGSENAKNKAKHDDFDDEFDDEESDDEEASSDDDDDSFEDDDFEDDDFDDDEPKKKKK